MRFPAIRESARRRLRLMVKRFHQQPACGMLIYSAEYMLTVTGILCDVHYSLKDECKCQSRFKRSF